MGAVMEAYERIPDLLERLPLLDELERRLGPGRRDGLRVAWCCPLPGHDDKSPSFKVYRAGAVQRWRCYGCGQAGDLIDAVMALDGVSKAEAIELLAARVGLDRGTEPAMRSAPPSPPRHVRARPQPERTFTAEQLDGWLVDCHAALLDPAVCADARPARDYLRARGVTGDEVRRFRLGYGVPTRVPKLPALQGRIVFGVPGVGAEGRVIPGAEEAAWNGSERYVTVGAKRAWGVDEARPTGPLVLVEGVFDRVALARAGARSVALRGKTLHPDDAAELRRLGFTRVYVALDRDASADDLEQVGQRLIAEHIEPVIVTGPADGDAGDLLTADLDTLIAAVSEAMCTP